MSYNSNNNNMFSNKIPINNQANNTSTKGNMTPVVIPNQQQTNKLPTYIPNAEQLPTNITNQSQNMRQTKAQHLQFDKSSGVVVNNRYDPSAQSKNSGNYEIISPNNMPFNNQYKMQEDARIEKVSERIYAHFKNKYPTSINATGLTTSTIKTIVIAGLKKYSDLNQSVISQLIDIIEIKIKHAINSENRNGKTLDTTPFAMDEKSHISMDKYLENFTSKVGVLNNSDKAIESNLPAKMAPVNDQVDIKEPYPFKEDFPLKNRENQTDMMIPEVREFDYYLMIDSKDRDIDKYPDPNNFIIELSPSNDTSKGYIDRAFGNIKTIELLNIIILDTSDQPDSSDAGGIEFPYLLLQFDEMQQNFFGTNNSLSKSFAILTEYCKPNNSKYKYYRMIGDSSDATVIKYYNPRINLSRITTRLLLPNGEPFNFGNVYKDDVNNTVISVSFRLRTIQRNLATQFLDKATY